MQWQNFFLTGYIDSWYLSIIRSDKDEIFIFPCSDAPVNGKLIGKLIIYRATKHTAENLSKSFDSAKLLQPLY